MKMFNHPYRYLFVVCLGLYSWINTSFVQTFEYYGIQANRLSQMLGFVLICLLVWEGNRILYAFLAKFVFKKFPKLYPVPLFFAVSHLVALASGIIVYFFITGWVLSGFGDNSMIALKLTVLFSFRINLFLHCINAIVYYLDRFQQKQVEAESLRRINTQAELQAIRNQVNPHFLFNNLNVLSTLIMQKSHDANQFIEAFSSVYRYILKNRDNEAVFLKTELEFIEPYIYLLKTRFGNALNVVLDIPSPAPDVYILPAALQLLLENAIKHNIISAARPLRVKLFIDEEGCFVVENNLQEKPVKPDSTEFGLYNINQRYKLLSGREIKIDKTEERFSVAIPLLKVSDLKSNQLTTDKGHESNHY